MSAENEKDEREGDTGRASKKGKGAGAEKGDHRREHRQHSGQTRNSPSARRGKDDEQSGHRNS
ncbi:MAG TPA: hypothetical protein PKD53_00855 [Chloroflexaceae bacterium]|nr:hypothetical protein [Chloroflexaceae bacterium]